MNIDEQIAVPTHTLEALNRYVEQGLPPGSFLRSVLENKLMESFAHADIQNRYAMFSIVNYVYNRIPFNCWGSPKIVDAWIEAKQKQRHAKTNS